MYSFKIYANHTLTSKLAVQDVNQVVMYPNQDLLQYAPHPLMSVSPDVSVIAVMLKIRELVNALNLKIAVSNHQNIYNYNKHKIYNS